MKEIRTFKDGTTLFINAGDARFSGYGHYKIEVELFYEGKTNTFSATTTNMPGIDEYKDLRQDDYGASLLKLYEIIEYQIQDEVDEFIDL